MTPLFTDTYQNSAGASPRPMVCRGEKKVEVPQKVLRCIWDEQLIRAEALETRAGEALEIVFPGHWNFGPGPDFKNAAIKVDGKTLEGDVVLNVYRPDALPVGPGGEFENAILSVYLWEGPAPHSMAKGTPHELQLKGRLTRGILELNDTLDFDSYPVLTQYDYGRCHKPLSRLSEEKLTRLLDAAGEARVQVEMDRFSRVWPRRSATRPTRDPFRPWPAPCRWPGSTAACPPRPGKRRKRSFWRPRCSGPLG